jgi:hypothetical protein
MYLRKEQVASIAHAIGVALKKGGVVLKKGEKGVVEKIESVIQKNIDDERAIDEQVKNMMDQYRNQIASGSVDPQRAFQMIKKQVAKERKFVL